MTDSKINSVTYQVNVGTNANPDMIKTRIPVMNHPSPIEFAHWLRVKQWGNAYVRQHVNLQCTCCLSG